MRHLEKFEHFSNSDNQKVNESPFFGRVIGEFVERGIKWLSKNVPKILSKEKPLHKPRVKSPSPKTTGKPQDDWATIKTADQNPFFSRDKSSTKVKTTKLGITMENGRPEDVRRVMDEAQKTGSDELRKLALGLSTKSIRYLDESRFLEPRIHPEIKCVSRGGYKQITDGHEQYEQVIKKLMNVIDSNTPFSTSNVKVLEKFILYPGTSTERECIQVLLPNGKTCLMYKSSGSNVKTTGKKKGEWFVLPGFALDKETGSAWFMKDKRNIELTKGGNQYLTQLAKWLEANGAEELNFLYWLNHSK